jgi:hypothetical protein
MRRRTTVFLASVFVALTAAVAAAAAGTGVWTVQKTLSPPDSVLEGVSCWSASGCIAVGDRNEFTGTLAESWNGSTWSLLKAPSPRGSDLRGASWLVSTRM